MVLKIKFFGQLTEITNCEEDQIEIKAKHVQGLILELQNKYPKLANSAFKVAQDEEIVSFDAALNGKEIALLPPFSGG